MKQIYDLLDYLDKKGCKIVSITEGFDSSTPVGQFFIGIGVAVAAFERALTVERTTAGIAAIREKRERGEKWRWGRKPTMTAAKIKQAGEMLNSGISGPEVARRMKVKPPTIYSYWQRNPNPKGKRWIRRPAKK